MGSDSNSYTNSCENSNSNSSCRNSSTRDASSCVSSCGLNYSDTLVGVWNFIYQYESQVASSETTIDRPSQLLFNLGGTFSSNSTPDLKNNPFGSLLSTGVGVWKQVGERRYKLEETHIGYRASDGAPSVYFLVHITMKLSKRGTKARICGRAVPKDISDPTLCTDTNGSTFNFTGHGYKILQPDCSK